jgi:hypothetical protein
MKTIGQHVDQSETSALKIQMLDTSTMWEQAVLRDSISNLSFTFLWF